MKTNDIKIENSITPNPITLIIYVEGVGAHSVHDVYLMKSNDEFKKEYYLFKYVSGTSVMNWNKDDYKNANKYLDISETPIVMATENNYTKELEFVNVPNDYRHW